MKFIRQLAVILSVCFVAECMEELIPLPVAAGIYGLALMLAGLVSGLIPLEKVEGAADFLVDAMPIFFIPATVAIMNSGDSLKAILLPLTVICVVSTLLIMAVTGKTAQYILRKERGSGGKGKTGTGPADPGQVMQAGGGMEQAGKALEHGKARGWEQE